ncbi:hypothetical protein A1I_04450 [Rickettsia bellii OSU 85-389]|nr:hypothetical protein [Rickettsia bellii]ABV79231.1 hypothetical protein A1I_04450 [Rickettsia bellii OSU 85-389]
MLIILICFVFKGLVEKRHCEKHSFDAISGCLIRLPHRGFATPRND